MLLSFCLGGFVFRLIVWGRDLYSPALQLFTIEAHLFFRNCQARVGLNVRRDEDTGCRTFQWIWRCA